MCSGMRQTDLLACEQIAGEQVGRLSRHSRHRQRLWPELPPCAPLGAAASASGTPADAGNVAIGNINNALCAANHTRMEVGGHGEC